jgi:hypothetical protein
MALRHSTKSMESRNYHVRLEGAVIYDGFTDPARKRRYLREVARAYALGALGLAFVAIVGWLVSQQGRPERSAAFAVFGGVVLFGAISYLLMTRGAKDSLRIYVDRVELPTRSAWDALLGRPNETMKFGSLVAAYFPPPDQPVPFDGFEREPGEVVLVHRALVGDRTRVATLLRERGVKVISEVPPPHKIVWSRVPRWVRRPSAK